MTDDEENDTIPAQMTEEERQRAYGVAEGILAMVNTYDDRLRMDVAALLAESWDTVVEVGDPGLRARYQASQARFRREIDDEVKRAVEQAQATRAALEALLDRLENGEPSPRL